MFVWITENITRIEFNFIQMNQRLIWTRGGYSENVCYERSSKHHGETWKRCFCSRLTLMLEHFIPHVRWALIFCMHESKLENRLTNVSSMRVPIKFIRFIAIIAVVFGSCSFSRICTRTWTNTRMPIFLI